MITIMIMPIMIMIISITASLLVYLASLGLTVILIVYLKMQSR